MITVSRFVSVLALFALLGCSQKESSTFLLTKRNTAQTPDEVVNNVVLIKQNDNYSCATTSVAMIISEYEGLHDKPLNKDDVWNLSGSSISTIRTLGNDLDGLRKICTRYGYKYEFIQDLKNEEVEYLLSKGVFLVAFIRVNDTNTHAIVLTGYSKKARLFYVNDPAGGKTQIPYPIMDIYWNALLSHPRIATHRGALVVFPKEFLITGRSIR